MHCGVMLVPAMLPCFPDDAHLTVVYGGEDPDPSFALNMQSAMRRVAPMVEPFAAATMGVNHNFGEHMNEPVLMVGLTPELVTLRGVLQQFSKSEYTEFRPHIAVPGIVPWLGRGHSNKLPRHVYFTQIGFWLGDDDRSMVWLGTGEEV